MLFRGLFTGRNFKEIQEIRNLGYKIINRELPFKLFYLFIQVGY